jgi:hypothetical protein
VVYAAAGDARRRVLHGRALTVLEHADAPAAELTDHALASGSAVLTFHERRSITCSPNLAMPMK